MKSIYNQAHLCLSLFMDSLCEKGHSLCEKGFSPTTQYQRGLLLSDLVSFPPISFFPNTDTCVLLYLACLLHKDI